MKFSTYLLVLLSLSAFAESSAKNVCDECPIYTLLMCGSDGATYGNPCAAECRNVQIAHAGPCTGAEQEKIDVVPAEDICHLCSELTLLTCGADGITYQNPCAASCRNVEIAHMGPCDTKEDTHVAKIFARRVCGTDGLTYRNPCATSCKNIAIANNGSCQ